MFVAAPTPECNKMNLEIFKSMSKKERLDENH